LNVNQFTSNYILTVCFRPDSWSSDCSIFSCNMAMQPEMSRD